MDAKNIELRIPAYESGEASLVELFEHPDDPPFYGSQHLLNCSLVYPDLWEEELRAVGIEKVGPHFKKKYSSSWYHWGKCGGLAIQYQCGPDTADRTFRRKGSYDRIKGSLRALSAHNDRQVKFANKHGWVETIPDRSICPDRGYPLMCGRTLGGGIKPTVPLNYRTQGSAGWWMVKALNRCQGQLAKWRTSGFDGFIALTVHDEILFDMPVAARNNAGQPGNLWRAAVLKRLMETGGSDIGVPTPVSVEYHEKNWAEGEDACLA